MDSEESDCSHHKHETKNAHSNKKCSDNILKLC